MATEQATVPSNPTKAASGKRRNKKSTATAAVQPEKPTPIADRTAVPSAPANETDPSNEGEGNESSHIKELQKNIRNINKKLSATQKVDSIIADNPNLSLDDLVQTKKINADQKAQALKKPGLQSQLSQLEEQLILHKKIEDDFSERLQVERERMSKKHEKEIDELRSELSAKTAETSKSSTREKLLVLSRFLRAAAARRQTDDDTSEESKAFEGVLLLLYGGDAAAVDAAEKLIEGEDSPVPSTEGTPLQVVYERVKALSLEYAPFAAEEAWVNGVAQAEDQQQDFGTAATQASTETDPTIANAGLTEAADVEKAHVTEEAAPAEAPVTELPPQAATGDEAANTAGADQWNSAPTSADATMDQSWVSVPRDVSETEAGANPLAANGEQKWGDEAPVENAPVPQAAGQDGFREVVHHGRGRGRGGFSDDRGRRGNFRGEGGRGRGGFRGDRVDRGDRGGYRGRGRGGPRGGRGGES